MVSLNDPIANDVFIYGSAFTLVGLFTEGLRGALVGAGLGCVIGLCVRLMNQKQE